MKKIILLFFALCAGFGQSVTAQQDDALTLLLHEMRYRQQFHIAVAAGANFDLAKSSSNPAASLLGDRSTVVPAIDVRLTHLFAPRFGWYADLRFKLFKNRNGYETWGSQLGEALLNKLLPGIDRLHLAYSVGGVFRIEGDHWQCYPRIGIGQSYYGTNRKMETVEDGEMKLVLDSDGSAICLDLGVSTQYRFTPHLALVLDVLWQQPLSRARGYLSEKEGEAEAREFTYRSSTIGRELNVSLGVNFCFDLTRR